MSGIIRVALAGNPNVGKSTLFNALTGLRQHTGNWAGKTVEQASGTYSHDGIEYELVDLPGAYSLCANSPEEEVTRDYLLSGEAACVVIVCGATSLERNLNLALQTIDLTSRAVLCLNMADEARSHGVTVDCVRLSELLGIPVCSTSAGIGEGLDELKNAVAGVCAEGTDPAPRKSRQHCGSCPDDAAQYIEEIYKRAADICSKTIRSEDSGFERRLKLDRLLTRRSTGIPIMLALLAIVFFITLNVASVISDALSVLFEGIGSTLSEAVLTVGASSWIHGLLVNGVYRVLSWVVAVMLPPMAIFFPLFTVLEDLGYLPRVAFNLDSALRKCSACGKQALTMWVVLIRVRCLLKSITVFLLRFLILSIP